MNIWKENILKDLEIGNLEYKMAEKFLADLRKEFGKENREAVKNGRIKKNRTRE